MYTTDAIVCGGRSRNTTDRIVWLFTREAGMVPAIAKGVREEKSKLRYALQDFSLTNVSLVRGRHDWRITGADAEANLYYHLDSRDMRATVMRVLQMLRRILPGEEAHPRLFDLVTDGLRTCAAAECSDELFEQVLTLRVLYALGYIAPDETYAHVLHAPTMHAALDLARTTENKRDIANAIEHAFTVSQL